MPAKTAKKKAGTKQVVSVEDISGCIIVYKDKKMAVDSVRISVGATISTGNFETARYDCGMTIRPIEADTDLDDMVDIGWDLCKAEVAKQVVISREKAMKQQKKPGG